MNNWKSVRIIQIIINIFLILSIGINVRFAAMMADVGDGKIIDGKIIDPYYGQIRQWPIQLLTYCRRKDTNRNNPDLKWPIVVCFVLSLVEMFPPM